MNSIKILFAILFLGLFPLLYSQDLFPLLYLQTEIKAGMTLKEFMEIYPDLFVKGKNETGKYENDETINGLTGNWGYTFEFDTLTWAHFSYYINEMELLNEENFKKCLKTAEIIIEKYKKMYGEPTELIEGEKSFKDPYKERHWGYDVIEARWVTGDEKIKVEFSFFGGKGEYFFQILINHFKADYPYFD